MFEWILNGGGVPTIKGGWTLVGEFNSITGSYGARVGVSGDGGTVLTSAHQNSELWIYIRDPNGSFIHKQTIASAGSFGYAAAISFDGSRLVVGPGSGNSLLIYTRDGGGGYNLTQTIYQGNLFGYNVRMSNDGVTLVSSAYGRSEVFIYILGGDGTFTLRQTLSSTYSSYGKYLLLSKDGKVLVIQSNSRTGSQRDVTIFKLSANGQFQLSTGLTGHAYYGSVGGISGDGETIALLHTLSEVGIYRPSKTTGKYELKQSISVAGSGGSLDLSVDKSILFLGTSTDAKLLIYELDQSGVYVPTDELDHDIIRYNGFCSVSDNLDTLVIGDSANKTCHIYQYK